MRRLDRMDVMLQAEVGGFGWETERLGREVKQQTRWEAFFFGGVFCGTLGDFLVFRGFDKGFGGAVVAGGVIFDPFWL